MKNSTEIITKWTSYATELLKGKTIVDVRYLTDNEMETFGWHHRPLAIKLDDNSWMVLTSDNEGNDGGSIQLITDKATKLVPTL